jgi:hypothetical protein
MWPPNLIELTRRRLGLIAKVATAAFACLDLVALILAISRGGAEWSTFGVTSILVAASAVWAFVLNRR